MLEVFERGTRSELYFQEASFVGSKWHSHWECAGGGGVGADGGEAGWRPRCYFMGCLDSLEALTLGRGQGVKKGEGKTHSRWRTERNWQPFDRDGSQRGLSPSRVPCSWAASPGAVGEFGITPLAYGLRGGLYQKWGGWELPGVGGSLLDLHQAFLI